MIEIKAGHWFKHRDADIYTIVIEHIEGELIVIKQVGEYGSSHIIELSDKWYTYQYFVDRLKEVECITDPKEILILKLKYGC